MPTTVAGAVEEDVGTPCTGSLAWSAVRCPSSWVVRVSYLYAVFSHSAGSVSAAVTGRQVLPSSRNTPG